MILEGHELTIGYQDRVVGTGLDVKLENGEVLVEEALAVLTGIVTSTQQAAQLVGSATDETQRHVTEGKRRSLPG